MWKRSSISFCISLHSAVGRRSQITFCLSGALATYYTLLEISFEGISKEAYFIWVFSSVSCKKMIIHHFSAYHITTFCSRWKVQNHFLSVQWFSNILFTVRKLFSRALQGYTIHLWIFYLHLQKMTSILFCKSLHSAIVRRSRITFCLSAG